MFFSALRAFGAKKRNTPSPQNARSFQFLREEGIHLVESGLGIYPRVHHFSLRSASVQPRADGGREGRRRSAARNARGSVRGSTVLKLVGGRGTAVDWGSSSRWLQEVSLSRWRQRLLLRRRIAAFPGGWLWRKLLGRVFRTLHVDGFVFSGPAAVDGSRI